MPRQRFDRIDALRGLAIVWMTVVPLLLRPQPFRLAPAGLLRRPALDLAAHRHRQPVPVLRGPGTGRRRGAGAGWPRFWKRWAQVAGCALLVTARFVLHVSAQLHLLRRAARHRGDADHRAPEAGWGRWLWLRGRDRDRGQAAGGVAHRHWPALDFLNARLELARPRQPQARHRRLRAAHPLAGRDVVGHGGGAMAAGASARLVAARACRRRTRRWPGWAAGA